MPYLIERVLKLFKEKPKIAIFMSGKGSNAREILKQRDRYPNLDFSLIFTDKEKSSAKQISQEFKMPYLCLKGKISNPEERNTYFGKVSEALEERGINAIIYAGFMKITPSFFLNRFPGINSHPADLTIKETSGKPKYTGMDVVAKILQNESSIASTIHIVDAAVDCGHPITVSPPLHFLNLMPLDPKDLHERLKTECEHKAFPKTLELLAKGKLTIADLPLRLKT